MNREEITKQLLQTWIDQQGHDRCWYYPDIFNKLCELYEVQITVEPNLPPKSEFEKGCKLYQDEQYEH